MVEPRSSKNPQRGEIWWVALDPTVGAEIRKTRPCLIISSNLINQHRRTVLAVPLSSSPQASPPILVPIDCEGKKAVAVTDQLRAISKDRLQNFIETAKEEEVEAVIAAVVQIIEG